MPIDVTERFIRIRQRDPARFEKGSFRTITLSEEEGIKAVIGRLIGQKTTTVQTYLFDRDKWTLAKAKQWVREHRGKRISATKGEEHEMVKLTATQAELDAQKARSRRYGISIREDGHVTKPGEWKNLPDSQWGDPVNYLYPVADEAHAKNAKSRFETNKGAYDSKSRGVVIGRLNRLLRKYDLAPIGEKTERGEARKMTYLIGEIQLEQQDAAEGEKKPKRIKIPAAHFANLEHPKHGMLVLDQDLFDSFIDNWHNKVIGVDLAVDMHHASEKGALAWVDDMQVEGGTLYLYGNPTSLGDPLLGDVYRYASVEYDPDYVDPATGFSYGPALLGCAATNRPFVPNQEAITVLSTDGEARIVDTSQPELVKIPDPATVKLQSDMEEFLTSLDEEWSGEDSDMMEQMVRVSIGMDGLQEADTDIVTIETPNDIFVLQVSASGSLLVHGPRGNLVGTVIDENTMELVDPDPLDTHPIRPIRPFNPNAWGPLGPRDTRPLGPIGPPGPYPRPYQPPNPMIPGNPVPPIRWGSSPQLNLGVVAALTRFLMSIPGTLAPFVLNPALYQRLMWGASEPLIAQGPDLGNLQFERGTNVLKKPHKALGSNVAGATIETLAAQAYTLMTGKAVGKIQSEADRAKVMGYKQHFQPGIDTGSAKFNVPWGAWWGAAQQAYKANRRDVTLDDISMSSQGFNVPEPKAKARETPLTGALMNRLAKQMGTSRGTFEKIARSLNITTQTERNVNRIWDKARSMGLIK